MLSKQITCQRKKAGMSQSQLAIALNVSPSTIGMYEQGRRAPDLTTLVSMSRLFGVSLDCLITGDKFVHFSPTELNSSPYHDMLTETKEQAGSNMIITDPAAIGTRLRQIRKSRKLSQSDLAAAAGISGRAYADIERGSANMRVETMLRICQALAVTPNDILTEPDIPADDHTKAAELLRLALDLAAK